MAGTYPYKDFPAPDPGPQPYYPDGQGFCLNVGDAVLTRFGEYEIGETAQMFATLLRVRNERLHGGNTGLDYGTSRTDGVTVPLFDSTAYPVAKIEIYDQSAVYLRDLPRRDENAEFPFGMARQIVLNDAFVAGADASFNAWQLYLMGSTTDIYGVRAPVLSEEELLALFFNATRIQPHVQIDVPDFSETLTQEKTEPYPIELNDASHVNIECRTEDQVPLPQLYDPASYQIGTETTLITDDPAWFTEPSIFYIGRSRQHFFLTTCSISAASPSPGFYPDGTYSTLYNTSNLIHEEYSIGQTVRLAANSTAIGGTWNTGTASTTDWTEGVIVDHKFFFLFTYYYIAHVSDNVPAPSEVTITSNWPTDSIWMWDTESAGMSTTTPGATGSDPLYNLWYAASVADEAGAPNYRTEAIPASNWNHPSATAWDLAPRIRRNTLRPDSWGTKANLLYKERDTDTGQYMHSELNKLTVDLKSPHSAILIDNFEE